MNLTVHCLVKNEDIWVKYALESVLPFAKKVLVFDNGSTDKTVEVIKSIRSEKIVFEQKGEVNRKDLIELRQEQIERTKTEWILILDGDEIWPEEQLKSLLEKAEKAPKNILGLINHTRNCVGDIYHYLPESAGHYRIGGHTGNLTVRLMRKTPNLKVVGEYPLESFGYKNTPIQNLDQNLLYTDNWYLHTTYLPRSTSIKNKTSGSLGKRKLPEVGLKINTSELPKVLNKKILSRRSIWYEIVAIILFPLLAVKRIIR